MSAPVTNQKLEGMLRKVRGLLAKADDDAATPAESQIFREKAEALMWQYRIDESMLIRDSSDEILPQWNRIMVAALSNDYRNFYIYLMRRVAEHVGVMGEFNWVPNPEDPVPGDPSRHRRWTEYHYVGFESDLRIVNELFTNCMLAFQTKLEPKYDPALSEQVNAYNMRKAGMEGWRIAMAIWGERPDRLLYKARKLFKAEALARGEDPQELLGQGNNMKVYRESYANGFVQEIRRRLHAMRQSRAQDGALVIADRGELIKKAFWAEYPHYAPKEEIRSGDAEEDEESEGGGVGQNHTRSTYVDPREGCERCQKAKSGYCREHSYLRPSTAQYRERAWSPAGDRAGRSAASSVDLGGGGPKGLE